MRIKIIIFIKQRVFAYVGLKLTNTRRHSFTFVHATREVSRNIQKYERVQTSKTCAVQGKQVLQISLFIEEAAQSCDRKIKHSIASL
jgi:hypothetical protein